MIQSFLHISSIRLFSNFSRDLANNAETRNVKKDWMSKLSTYVELSGLTRFLICVVEFKVGKKSEIFHHDFERLTRSAYDLRIPNDRSFSKVEINVMLVNKDAYLAWTSKDLSGILA